MGKKISRRSFIKKTVATAAITGISSILLTQQAPANITINKKPNILFILNDQERAWPFIQNNIDLPARRYLESISTYFNRSYTTTPICSPARSSVYTGQHVQFTGVWDNTVVPWTPGLYENVNTIGHLLTNENYETGYFGKWHLSNITESNTNENALGFDGMKKMFKKYGFYNFYGADLSQKLLDLVPKELYQKLDKVDLNKQIKEEDNSFDAIMCVGTFTFGHVKPPALDEFIRITKNKGLICFTINEGIHEEYGFDKKIDQLINDNKWKKLEFFKSNYIASKDVNAWLGLFEVIK